MQKRTSKALKSKNTGEDAVSPVVGVMLLLVVTVIIAAVVATFASGLVTTQQTVPTLAADVKIVSVDSYAFALHKGPHFGTTVVYLIGGAFSRVQCECLGKGVVTIFVYSIVEDTVGAPTTFFVHGSGSEVLHCILDAFGTALLAH